MTVAGQHDGRAVSSACARAHTHHASERRHWVQHGRTDTRRTVMRSTREEHGLSAVVDSTVQRIMRSESACRVALCVAQATAAPPTFAIPQRLSNLITRTSPSRNVMLFVHPTGAWRQRRNTVSIHSA